MSKATAGVNEPDPRRHRRYPTYKPSGIEWLDEIPANWEAHRLRFIVETGITKREVTDLDPETEVSFVPMEAVREYGGIDLSTKPLADVVEGYTYFRNGDVIVAKITPCFENGKGALATGLCNDVGFGTTELHVLRASFRVDPRFLLYLTFSDHFRRIGTASMYGAGGQKRISDDFIRDFRHPVPGLPEQRAIVAFLDFETAKIDTLLTRKERLIELLQEKRTALITHAVTRGLDPNVPMKDSGVEWLGQIPAHWEVCRLRHVVSKFVDYRGKTPEKSVSGVPLITARNIKNQSIDFSLSEEFIPEELYPKWMVRGRPERGDVVITTEAPLGETAQVVDTGIALAQRVILLKVEATKITNDYLKYHFAADSGRMELRTRATGSTALGIKASHLRSSLIAVPSTCEQDEISRTVRSESEQVDVLIAKVREAIGRLREFRTALISAAVTGKIDVREAVPR